MFGRIGNDVLRAVALLGGLIVAGALLLSTADPRIAQFRFEHYPLGVASDAAAVVSLALDARVPAIVYASADALPRDPQVWAPGGAIRRAPEGGDLAVDAEGIRYGATASDLGIMVTRRAPDARPSETARIPARVPHAHIVAREDGLIVVSAVLQQRLRVWRSTDRAETFVAGGEIASPVAAAGPVIVGPFGSLFAGVVTPDGLLGVAASADGGVTWSARGVTTVTGVDLVPPAIAVDDAATLYIAFTKARGDGPRLLMANSRDLSLTWSQPITVAPPGSHSPQLVAGSLGRIGLAYLSGQDDELVYRYTSEGLLARPFWTEHLVEPNVTCRYPCARAPYEMTLTTTDRAVFGVRSAESLIVAEQRSGSGVR